MIVSTLRMSVLVREARSLKDKRRVIKSMKDRLHNKFNVSVAEVGDHQSHRTAVVGVALVSTERRFADQVFQQVLAVVRATPGAELCTFEMEI